MLATNSSSRHRVPMNAEQETLDRHYAAAVAIVSAAGYGANWLLRERLNLSYWRRAEGATRKELAKSYNVGRATISRLPAYRPPADVNP